jgi:hypothetical protein
LGYLITEVVKWLDSFPVVAHLQYVNTEHLRGDAFPIESLTNAEQSIEKLSGITRNTIRDD